MARLLTDDAETTAEAAQEAEEEVPDEPADPVTRPGDLWLIGKHRLICADCRDSAAIRSLLGGARIW